MNAIDLLSGQHDEVEDLFEAFEEAASTEEKRGIAREISNALAAHASIEEKIFYPAVYTGELSDKLHEAVEEHLSAKRVIADLLALDTVDETYEAKVKVLQELIEHHVEEEEGELFPRVKESLSADDLEMYGAQMEAMYAELMQEEPRKEVPNETAEAAPLPE